MNVLHRGPDEEAEDDLQRLLDSICGLAPRQIAVCRTASEPVH